MQMCAESGGASTIFAHSMHCRFITFYRTANSTTRQLLYDPAAQTRGYAYAKYGNTIARRYPNNG